MSWTSRTSWRGSSFPIKSTFSTRRSISTPNAPTEEEFERFVEEFRKEARPLPGERFGIPYSILLPKAWSNRWVADRCNSADVKVHGSIRVMPAAAMMGQAVGTTAVQSIKTGQPACDLNTAQLIDTLRNNGAYLPQVSAAMTRDAA